MERTHKQRLAQAMRVYQLAWERGRIVSLPQAYSAVVAREALVPMYGITWPERVQAPLWRSWAHDYTWLYLEF